MGSAMKVNGYTIEPGADLRRADLRDADLQKAKLYSANLQSANLQGAKLQVADLRYADLQKACLRDAKLQGADLHGAYLHGAKLTGTCLDPDAVIPELTDEEIISAGLRIEGDRVYGRRTRKSRWVGNTDYTPGLQYWCPVFSVCTETECHPGLYLASDKWLDSCDEYDGCERVDCYCLRSELVHAGDKWRAKRLWICDDCQPEELDRRTETNGDASQEGER